MCIGPSLEATIEARGNRTYRWAHGYLSSDKEYKVPVSLSAHRSVHDVPPQLKSPDRSVVNNGLADYLIDGLCGVGE